MQVQKPSNIEKVDIPKEWNIIKISEIGTVTDGDWILAKHYTKEGVRLIQVGDIGQGYFLDKSHKYISKETALKLKCSIVNQGIDILISRMPEPIGRACMAPLLPYSYIVAVDISILTSNKKIIENNFLIYLLNFENTLNQVQQFISGSTRQRISRKNLENITLLLPPIKEQQKIASILSNVDNLIQKTGQAIEQTQRLKKGLMQKLLIKGIGHTKFKKTDFGDIPEEWNIVKIKDISLVNPETINEKYQFKDINYIEIGAIKDYQIRSYANYKVSNRPSRAQRIVKKGDIIISTVRPYLKGFALIENEIPNLVCSTGFAVIRLKNKIDINFVFNYIKSKYFENIVFKQMEGMAYPAITSSDVANVMIPYPNADEEKLKIGSALHDVDLNYKLYNSNKLRLENLKKGLMQQLLTGKIRIKI